MIELHHLGRERVIGAWLVGDVIVDPGPSSTLEELLAGLDGATPRALHLTHIHLDHAGASGSLVERFPDLQVYVHELGAPHMAAPEKLLKSAKRLYGEDMDRLWGEFRPVPEANIHLLSGDETLPGGWEVAYTPGHASHHVTYFHEGTAYCGDVGGVRISPGLAFAPTPPPDIDLERWHASIDLLAERRPERLAVTHFGAWEDVEHHLGEVSRRLDAWAALARDRDEAGFIAAVSDEVERASGDDLAMAEAATQAAPPDQLYAGLSRYWEKHGG